jgi:hypothetical protein
VNRMGNLTFFDFPAESTNSSLLSTYFRRNRDKLSHFLPEKVLESESRKFEYSINSLIERYETIFESQVAQRVAYLVLGRVQSGKTAHLLGNLAWAADSKNVSFAVVFTGTALALNKQGVERLVGDLRQTQGQRVLILEAPTSPTSPKFEEAFQEFRTGVMARISKGEGAPLPIFVSIKKPGRIRAILAMKKRLMTEFGNNIANLLIDDEADQASQNAGAQKRTIAATYGAMATLFESGKTVMLSYTATPQAIQLTEKFGKLRPDYCHVVSPREGYFGLKDILSAKYNENIHVVDDLYPKITSHSTSPDSLHMSILVFVFTHLIRDRFPKSFYHDRLLEDEDLSKRMSSIQMLIHESGSQANHAHAYKLVRLALGELRKRIDVEFWHSDPLVNSGWIAVSRLALGLKDGDLTLDQTFKESALKFLDELQIRIVNADPYKATGNEPLPVSTEDWEEAPGWILIGGEILGRGLTIPQLTVSYFVRSSMQPKFDTVAQQMRFCGYRADYARLTHIFSTQYNLQLFEYMEGIDRVLWRQAKRQHDTNTNLKDKNQPTYYVSSVDSPLDPCRRSVKDPDLRDTRITKNSEVIFSLRDIFNPIQVSENVELINGTFAKFLESVPTRGNFRLIEHVDAQDFANFLRTWVGPYETRNHLRSVASLFDDSLGDWGLASIPIAIFVKTPTFSNFNKDVFFESLDPIERGVNPTDLVLEKWKQIAEAGELTEPVVWPSLKVGHVGDGQRSLRNSLGYDALVAVIEPIKGIKTGNSKPIAYGLGFTVFRPSGFELRVISHK